MTSIETLDYVGVALFAATGALAASRKQLDIIGFLFLAAVSNQTPDRNHFETGRVSIYNERTSIFRGVRLLFPLFSNYFNSRKNRKPIIAMSNTTAKPNTSPTKIAPEARTSVISKV